MFYSACLAAIAAGLLNPMQSGLTTALQQAFGRPFLVATASLSVSLAAALVGAACEGGYAGIGTAASKAPWWAWLAGLAGLCILVARPFSAPHLGASAFTGLTVTAAVVGALVLDQFGWLGFERHPIELTRALGAILMIAGAVIVDAS